MTLQLGDGGFQLRHRGADVRQFDDVRFRFGGEISQFGESVADLLVVGEILREIGDDASGERDVPGLDRDAGMLGERLDDWQKGIGREGRRFVGLCVDDGRKLGHVCWLKLSQRLRVLTGHGQKQLLASPQGTAWEGIVFGPQEEQISTLAVLGDRTGVESGRRQGARILDAAFGKHKRIAARH